MEYATYCAVTKSLKSTNEQLCDKSPLLYLQDKPSRWIVIYMLWLQEIGT